MIASEITKKDNEFRDYFSAKIKEYRKAANKEALEKLSKIFNRLLNENNNGIREYQDGIYYLEIFDFEGKDWIVKFETTNLFIDESDRARNYIWSMKPDLAPPPPKDTQTPAPDEIEPPQPPKEGKGESVIIPPGTYYFQYNVMAELGLIDEIQSRYLEINKTPISNSEMGQILFDIFQHKSPSEWSKAYSQYNKNSSNDPIKSDAQQKRLQNFLRQNNLKK